MLCHAKLHLPPPSPFPFPSSLQISAEQRAADAAKQGAARRLKESEARVEALEASVAELRDELERQVGAGCFFLSFFLRLFYLLFYALEGGLGENAFGRWVQCCCAIHHPQSTLPLPPHRFSHSGVPALARCSRRM